MPQTAQNIAHDLRNMLGVIIGMCEVREPNIGAIRNSAEQAHALLSRLFPEPVDPAKPGEFDLNDVVLDVYDIAQSKTARTGIDILLDLCGERFFSVAGERLDLHRALVNLCLNAIAAVMRSTACEQGRIAMETLLGEDGQAIVQVKDNGIGMTAEELNRLFTHEPLASDMHGRGFGVVRSSISRLGGRLDVKSEPGVGSVFTISLPLVDGTVGA